MKLIYICQFSIPTEKAHGVQIANTCASLAAHGVEVELVAPSRTEAERENFWEYYNVPRTFLITRLDRPTFARFGKIGYVLKTLFFLRRAARYAVHAGAHAVYTREPLLGVWMRGHILSLHAYPRCGARWYDRWLWKRTAGLVVITSFMKQWATAAGVNADRIFVTPNGVDEDQLADERSVAQARAELSMVYEREVVGYVGKYFSPFGRGTGVDELIRAFPSIKKKRPRALLMLVGINETAIPLVREKIRIAGISDDDVVIHTHVPRSQVSTYLRAADVLIAYYPYSKHHAYKMSPMKVFDYMASGRAIVAADLPAMREVLPEECGVLVPPDNEQAFVRTVVEVLSDPERARRMSKNARLRAASLTWYKRAERLLAFIHNVKS